MRLLKVFDAVVRCGGFSAAQSELNVGQSTISMQIAQLEVRLGTRLCERGRGGFRLTEQGRTVSEATKRLLTSIDNFRSEVDLLKRTVSGTLNLGLIDNTVTDNSSPLPAVLKRFLARGPEIGVHVFIGSPSELEQRVLDGRLHAAVGHFPHPVPGLDSIKLYDEPHGLFCNAHHALANMPENTLGELIEQLRRARVVARGYLRRKDLDLLQVDVAAVTADNVEAQAILILSGSCIGFLPLHYAAQWVAQNELRQMMPDHMTLTSQFTAITQRMTSTPLVKIFVSELSGMVNGRADLATENRTRWLSS